VNRQDAGSAPSEEEVDRVSRVNPTGNLREGATIDVFVYSAVATPPAPTAVPAVSPARESVPVSAPFNITWTNYNQCPSGTTLTGYTVTATGEGASVTSTNPSNSTTATIQAGADAGEIEVSYTVTCGDTESAASPTLKVTVAAASTPTPTPTSTPND
jgi:hypothetical protein